MEIGFCGPSYQSRSIAVDGERSINMYPELVESGHGASPQAKWALYGTPGRYLLCTLSDSPCSCLVSSDQLFGTADVTPIYYAIAGSTLFQIAIHYDPGTQKFVGTPSTIGTVDKKPLTGGQLFPSQILVLGRDLLFAVANGRAWVAGKGSITSSTTPYGGLGYAVGDTGTIDGGAISAAYTVNSVDGSGAVLTYTIDPTGFGYSVTDPGVATTTSGGTQPGVGAGFQIDITGVNAGWSIVEVTTAAAGPGGFIQAATYMDGYTIISLAPNTPDPQRRQFFISALNDPTSWNGLDSGEKEANPDPIQAPFAAYEILVLFGLQTIEQWQDSGDANFPFARVSGGGVLENGLASPWTVAKADGTLCWLGTDIRGGPVAWTMRGYSPVRISNHAVEEAWRAYDVTGSSAYAYQEAGHFFYVVHFPIPNKTWVADTVTMAPDGKPCWHERAAWDGTHWNADIGRYHAYSFPVGHAVGDYRNGNIYVQTLDALDDNGTPIRRLRATPHVNNEQRWNRYARFRLQMQTGIVPASGPGSDPTMSLRQSDDGGFTFGPYLDRSAGLIGNYGAVIPIEWYRLGASRNRVLEVSTSDPVPQAWVDAYLEVIPGRGV